jgi:hypothetical protein
MNHRGPPAHADDAFTYLYRGDKRRRPIAATMRAGLARPWEPERLEDME